MTKRELAALERAFVAEATFSLPAQGKSKAVERLLADGYLEPMEVWMGSVRVTGHQLTHLGRMTYCEQCSDEDGGQE